MKQEDKQYEEWLSEVRNKLPILKNPEDLTTAIISKISSVKSKRKRHKFLLGIWTSGIAATLLLLLLMSDIYFAPPSSEMEKQMQYENWSTKTSVALPDNWNEMKLSEKNMYLYSQYTQCRQQRQTRLFQMIKENRLK